MTIVNPTDSEDVTVVYFDEAVTITKMVMVVGGSSPSLDWTLRHDASRNAAGSEVVTGGDTTTDETTGDIITTFDDATIPAGSFLWFGTSAKSGTVDFASLTIFYTVD